jgi:hypothetical protein
MPSPPLVDVPLSDPIGQGQGFRLITPSAPVAVKRVDAAVHVEPCTNKSRTGQVILLFEIDVGHGHKKLRKWTLPGVILKYRTRTFLFQVRSDGHLNSEKPTDPA